MKCYQVVAHTERMKTGRPGNNTVANALREVIGIVGKADNSNLRIHLKFESFLEKENDAE